MKRKEEILQAAIKEHPRFAERRVGFIAGAEWSDKTMIEKGYPTDKDGKFPTFENLI